MKVAMLLPGLPTQSGGASLASILQARAIGLVHELHAVVLGDPDPAALNRFRGEVPGEVHCLSGVPQAIDDRIRELLRHLQADVVQVESLVGAEWISNPRRLGPGAVYRAYDATFSVLSMSIRSAVNQPTTRLGAALERVGLRRPLLALANMRLRRHEMRLARRFDRVLCFSAEDRNAFGRLGIRAGVVPLPMDAAPEPHRPDPSSTLRMAFVASFSYFPNVDALAYLLTEIIPALPAALAWRLDVIGGQPPAFARMQKDRRVRIRGYVEDLQDTMDQVDVFLVPLRFGGGVKLKTMTALARGIPTITSTAGGTGLAVRDGEHALIRDTPMGFAGAIQALAGDLPLRRKLGESGRRLITQDHAPRAVARALELEYETVMNSGAPR